MGWRYGAGAALLVGALSAAACASLVGADFDGLGPKVDASASGGNAGAGGAGTGGTDAGSGGSSASGGTSGTGATGGSSGSGGAGATGGTSGSGGSGATGGTAGSSGTGGTGATGGTGGTAGTGGGGATGGAGGTGGTAGTAGTGGGCPGSGTGSVVINEIRGEGSGSDYVELKNTGSGPFDLSGWGVTDASGTNGPPNYSTGTYFPSGTTLCAGDYLLVIAQQAMTGGPYTGCFGYTPTCYYATFGVSSGGERIYLLDSTNSYHSYVDYQGGLANGQTWGRIPDGTGNFKVNVPTPGATNSQ